MAKSELEELREENRRWREHFKRKNAPTCPVKNVYCFEHGYYHGQEAEELRKGIEKVLTDWCYEENDPSGWITDKLTLLLDEVDARDSLAFIEGKERDWEYESEA